MAMTVLKALAALIVVLEGLYVAVVIVALFLESGADDFGHSVFQDSDWYVAFGPFMLGVVIWFYAASALLKRHLPGGDIGRFRVAMRLLSIAIVTLVNGLFAITTVFSDDFEPLVFIGSGVVVIGAVLAVAPGFTRAETREPV
jgi:hypothetical protein